MKILFVSMPSIHTTRWIENLAGTNHELYWFDVLGKGNLESNVKMVQYVNWKKRKLPYLKGEHFLRKKFPRLYLKIQPLFEVTANEKLVAIINEIQPDLIHSFEMQSCSYPILKTMNKFPTIKWLYSCWGSDMYKYKEESLYLPRIISVLKRINYLHTDCLRDFKIAKEFGFKGYFSGVIPGGGGFQLENFEPYYKTIESRKIILVKGYQHHVGRGLNIVKALETIKDKLNEFEVVVFGTHKEVIGYINKRDLRFKVFTRHQLTHNEVVQFMGKSIIYVGNSISDGIPNTLLEAIIMGTFPIQSNPGGVTSEIITHNKNGLLIENPESITEIASLLELALANKSLLNEAQRFNKIIGKERLDYGINQQKIVALYKKIENDTCE